jgi:hypothetical protein
VQPAEPQATGLALQRENTPTPRSLFALMILTGAVSDYLG